MTDPNALPAHSLCAWVAGFFRSLLGRRRPAEPDQRIFRTSVTRITRA